MLHQHETFTHHWKALVQLSDTLVVPGLLPKPHGHFIMALTDKVARVLEGPEDHHILNICSVKIADHRQLPSEQEQNHSNRSTLRNNLAVTSYCPLLRETQTSPLDALNDSRWICYHTSDLPF